MISEKYQRILDQMPFLRSAGFYVGIITILAVGLFLSSVSPKKPDAVLGVVRDVRALQVEQIQQAAAVARLLIEQRRLLTEQTKLLQDMVKQQRQQQL